LEETKTDSMGTDTVSLLIKPGIELDKLINTNYGNIGEIYKFIKESKNLVVKIYKNIKHKDIVSLPPKNHLFIRVYKSLIINDKYVQIMECCDGNIKELKIKFTLIHILIFGLLLLKYNISHGDIKPNNFLSKNGKIKLTDFDGCIKRQKNPKFTFNTDKYLPNSLKCDSFSVDLYALGKTCLESMCNYKNLDINVLGKYRDLIDQNENKRLIAFYKLLCDFSTLIPSLVNSLNNCHIIKEYKEKKEKK